MKKEHINPAGMYKHPAFTRVVSVEGPMKLLFVAGQTPADENYNCVAPGDMRAQYTKVMESLELQLKAVGATWDDVVYRRIFTLDVDEYLRAQNDPQGRRYWGPDKLPGSTLIGVTRLSNPEFLVEVDLVAVVPAA
jgi:enamine deaminase RidA (YjgF/YER057c/UK114 family)